MVPRSPTVVTARLPEATRGAFNKRFLLDLAEDWQQHGREVFKRVRRESPAAYLKVCAMLPREMKLEHSGGVKAMTDEQLERSIEILRELIAKREAEANAKVIEGVAEPVPALPPNAATRRRRLGAGVRHATEQREPRGVHALCPGG